MRKAIRLYFGAFRRLAVRAASDERGAIMTEAAIVFPVLVMMLLGMFEFSQAFTARRRVQAVASTAADLVAQNATVTTADLNDIASIGAQLMLPFSTTGLTLTITNVGQDNKGNPVILWGCTWSNVLAAATCSTGGAFSGLPSGLFATTTDSVIVGQTSYTYTPAIGEFLVSGVHFTGASYFKPRRSQTVTKQ
ncbi:MAG: TadE/TadG family type IV pilus assembly protein [Rhodomicrobium sp.]|jgi:Flp pilus assembly protein TadG